MQGLRESVCPPPTHLTNSPVTPGRLGVQMTSQVSTGPPLSWPPRWRSLSEALEVTLANHDFLGGEAEAVSHPWSLVPQMLCWPWSPWPPRVRNSHRCLSPLCSLL